MLKYFLAPLLGGVIGYITNDLAIRMLFRPRREIRIGKWRVPFTPGLIPRQRERIAASIGSVVSSELLDPATLRQTLLSENVLSALRFKLDEIFREWQNEPRSLREKLTEMAGEETVRHYEEQLCAKSADVISQKLVAADAGGTVMRAAMNSLKEKHGFGLLTGLMDDTVTQNLGGRLNRLIAQNAPSFLESEIGRLEDELLDQPVSALYEKYADKAEPLKERIMGLYRLAIEQKLAQALAAVNIEQMVTDKINAFSAEELEALILSVMKKELRAIVFLGALLGSIMGFLNLLF